MLLSACGQRGPLVMPTVPPDPRLKDPAPSMQRAPAPPQGVVDAFQNPY